MTKICFLCGSEIEGKVTKEHIIGDKFLSIWNLKNEKYRYNKSSQEREYSRLKVPAHGDCNSGFGSRFETYILKIISTLDENSEVLEKLHYYKGDAVVDAVKEAICQWLAKIYVGLIFWEASYPKHENSLYQREIYEDLDPSLVRHLQKCFREENYYNVPTSLYYFKLYGDFPKGFEFDFSTGLPYGSIYIKIGQHLFVACIADGLLVEEWFTNEQYVSTVEHLKHCYSDPAAHLAPVSQIWSVRENLPVQPNIEYHSDSVADKSRLDCPLKPEINSKTVNVRAQEIYWELCERYRDCNS